MECQKCQQRPANVHITQIVNGERQETHLCEVCAQDMKIKLGFPQFPMQNFTNLLGFLTQSDVSDKQENSKCPTCRIPYRKIGELGYVGCSECYRSFNPQLGAVLRKIHGSNKHRGKIPQRLGSAYVLKREIEELKNSLRQEVERERYEEAARIRDQIKELEEKMARGDKK